jgi:hypothetical protein
MTMLQKPGRIAGHECRVHQGGVWKRLLAAAALLLLAAAAPAQTGAQDLAGPWQFSVFGGGWNSLTAPYVYRTSSTSAEVGFGNAACFGLSAGVNASKLLGLELAWTQTSPAQQFTGSPPSPIRNVTMNIFELDSLWYFSRGSFQTFAIFGLGGTNTGSSFGGANLTVVVGLGVKAFLGRHFAVRADVRWDNVYGNVGHAGGPAFCDSAGCYDYRTGWYGSLPVTVGLTYAF